MMKKLHLSAIAMLAAVAMNAQDSALPKAFSFTVVPDGDTPAVISSITTDATGEPKMQIDWGDGVLTEPVVIEDYQTTWTPTVYSAVPKGKVITVYADPATIHYIDGSWGVGTLKWTSVDVTALTELNKLEVPSNALTAIDVTKNLKLTKLNVSCNDIKGAQDLSVNTELTSVDFSNTETLGTNNIDGTDFSVLKKVSTINVSVQTLKSLKVAGLSALTSLNITSCHLPEIDLTGCSKLKTLNGNNNDFETIDISGCATDKSTFHLNNGKLKSIKTADAYTGNTRLNITNNNLTFSTLPSVGLFKNYSYSPQAEIAIEATGNKVDLSEYMPVIGENATVAAWTDGETALVEGTDYTVEKGVFTFITNAADAKVALTNAAFPGLTLNSNAVKIDTTGALIICADADNAVYYNVNGQRVAGNQPGLYIKVANGKASKVLVK